MSVLLIKSLQSRQSHGYSNHIKTWDIFNWNQFPKRDCTQSLKSLSGNIGGISGAYCLLSYSIYLSGAKPFDFSNTNFTPHKTSSFRIKTGLEECRDYRKLAHGSLQRIRISLCHQHCFSHMFALLQSSCMSNHCLNPTLKHHNLNIYSFTRKPQSCREKKQTSEILTESDFEINSEHIISCIFS